MFSKILKFIRKVITRFCKIVVRLVAVVVDMYYVNDPNTANGSVSSTSTSRNQKGDNYSQVVINVYDITKGSAKKNTMGLLEGIWHTGLEVFGQEYFYCKHGILTCIPKEYEVATYHHSINMGESKMSETQFKAYLEYYKATTYQGKDYRQITHNCNNFTEEMTKLLVGRGIPDDSVWRL